jgi:hypothetical protein
MFVNEYAKAIQWQCLVNQLVETAWPVWFKHACLGGSKEVWMDLCFLKMALIDNHAGCCSEGIQCNVASRP